MNQFALSLSLPDTEDSSVESSSLMLLDIDCLADVVTGILERHLDYYMLDSDLVSLLLKLDHFLKFVPRGTPIKGETYVL